MVMYKEVKNKKETQNRTTLSRRPLLKRGLYVFGADESPLLHVASNSLNCIRAIWKLGSEGRAISFFPKLPRYQQDHGPDPPLVLNCRPPDGSLTYYCRRRKIQPITQSHSTAAIPGCNLLPNFSREREAPDQVHGCFQTSKAEQAEIFIWPAPSFGVSRMDLAF